MTPRKSSRGPLLIGLASISLLLAGTAASLLFDSEAPQPAMPGLAVSASTNSSFTISRPTVVSRSPLVIIERGTVSLAKMPSREPSTDSDIFAALASGEAGLLLENAHVSVEENGADAKATAGAGASGKDGELEDAYAPLIATLAAFDIAKLQIRNSTIAVRGAGGTRVRFTNVTADLTKRRGETLGGTGSVTFAGEPISFEGTIGLPPKEKNDTLLPLKLHLKSSLFEAKLDGRAGLGDNLQLSAHRAEITTSKLRKLSGLLGRAWPEAPGLDVLSAKGLFEWSEGTATFESAEIEIDGNAGTGSLALSPGKNRPRLDGTLAFEEFKLDPYVPAAAESGAMTRLARALLWFPLPRLVNEPIPSLINALDADLRISATSVTLSGAEIGHGAATVAMKDGLLDAGLTEIMLPNGAQGDALITADATKNEPRYTLSGKLDRLDLARATETFFGVPIFKGEGSLVASVEAAGSSGQSFLETLAGKIDVRGLGATSLEANVAVLTAAAEKKPQEGWTIAKGSTPIDDLTLRMWIKDGVINADGIKGRAGRTQLELLGSVSTASRTLDLTLTSTDEFKMSSPANGQKGAMRALELRGAWTNPSIRSATEAPVSVSR